MYLSIGEFEQQNGPKSYIISFITFKVNDVMITRKCVVFIVIYSRKKNCYVMPHVNDRMLASVGTINYLSAGKAAQLK